MSEENVSSTATEVVDPVEELSVVQAVEQAATAAGLSKRDAFRVARVVKRDRGSLLVELFRADARGRVAMVTVRIRGRLRRVEEHEAELLFEEQVSCMGKAGHAAEDALYDASRIAREDIRSNVTDSILGATNRYLRSTEKRAGRKA